MAIKDVFRGVAQSTRKRFYDNFNRADQSGLGTATDGSIWNILRGSFSISANTVVGADANYPMATQSLPFSNVEINLNGTTQGSAAALWVTDSGNWWAVGMTQEPENCNCTYYYNSYYYYTASSCPAYYTGTNNGVSCNGFYNIDSCINTFTYCSGTYSPGFCNNYACNGYNVSTCNNYACNGYNTSTCASYNAYNAKTKTGGTCASYNGSNCQGYRCSGSNNGSNCQGYRCSGSTNSPTCNSTSYICNMYSGSNCNGNMNTSYYNGDVLYYYACSVPTIAYNGPFASCSTCYPQYIRVLQSVANTVSVVTQWSIGTLASALKIKTSDSQITISAYSDSSMVTQIGSNLIYTPTGVAITPAFGLTVIPSSYNQGYATDAIEIKKN